jgi:hypothetical protein
VLRWDLYVAVYLSIGRLWRGFARKGKITEKYQLGVREIGEIKGNRILAFSL